MNILDAIQKNWKVLSVMATAVVTAITWVVNLEPRIPDDVEEMIGIREAVKAMPTKESRAIDSLNDAHAMEIRQLRYEDAKLRDSINDERARKKDSLWIDMAKRFTVQIEQLEEKVDEALKDRGND